MKLLLQNTWKVLLPAERKKFSVLIALDIFFSVLDILSLVALLWIVQFYVSGEIKKDILPAWMREQNSPWPIGIFLLLFALKNAAGYLINRSAYRFISHVAVRISKMNLESYQYAPFEEFTQVDSSVHIRKIAFQPYEFCQYVLTAIQQIVTQGSLVLLAIVAILLFNAKLFLLLLLILLPPAILVFYLIKKRSERNKSGIQTSNENSFRFLLDALKGYVEGNVYGRNQFFMERFLSQRKLFSDYLFNSLSLQSLPGRFIEVFAVLGLFLLILIAGMNGNAGHSTLVVVGAFIAAAYKIIPGMVRIINAMGQMKAYEPSLDQLVKESKLKSKEPAGEKLQSIQLKDVDFSYGNMDILRSANLCVQQGDFVGITGYSGIGKTTALNLLLSFAKPKSGEVLINQKQVDQETIRQFWPQISYVRQQPFFIHDTILKNITLQENGVDEKKMQQIISITGLHQLLANYPEGLEKIITENGKNISGGQQQRIAVARALYHDASLYLLDEPFNELDEESEAMLLGHFQQLAKEGKMVVMVTHHKKALSYCNKIISLHE